MEVSLSLHTESVDVGAAGDEVKEDKAGTSTANSEGSLLENESEGTSKNTAELSDVDDSPCMKSDMGNLVAQETGKQRHSLLCSGLACCRLLMLCMG